MPIEKLDEFAKNGQKSTEGIILENGFPQEEKPARQWFNYIFNSIAIAINTVIDSLSAVETQSQNTTDMVDSLGVTVDGISSDKVLFLDDKTLTNTWNTQFDKSSIFGQTGVKFLADYEEGVHNGWGSYIEFASGKLVFIYRKAANHAILNTAAIWAKDSLDGGKTWVNHRLVISSTTNDLRPDPLKLMANNRGGTFINRSTTTSGGYFQPLFLYTDDEGVTWQQNIISTTAPYTFQSTGGLLEFPASVGGHDTLGFMGFGFLSAGGLDALTTVDNGNTWTQVNEVAVQSGEITALSEWAGARIGDSDRWVFVTRSRIAAGWNPKMIIWVTDNPLNWGTWRDSGLGLDGNPPAMLYDEDSNDIVILAPSRADRAIVGFPEDTLLQARINADTLYSANGVIGNLVKYRIIAALPNWLTAYLAPSKISGKWSTALTCGEFSSTGAVQVMLGDFTGTGGEISKLTKMQVENNTVIKELGILNNITLEQVGTGYPFNIRSSTDNQIYSLFRPTGALIKGTTTYDISSNVPITFDNKVSSSSRFNIGTASDAIQATHNARLTVTVDSATSPAWASVTGSNSTRKHIVFVNGNGAVGAISTTDSTTSYTTTSDYRAKTVDGDYEKSLSDVNSIKVYDAFFNKDPKSLKQPMVLAHELQEVCPYAVIGSKDEVDSDGNDLLQQVDYSKIVPVLIGAIQELSKEVEALKNKE